MNEALQTLVEHALLLSLLIAAPAFIGHLLGGLAGEVARRYAGATDASLSVFPRQLCVAAAMLLTLPITGPELVDFLREVLILLPSVALQ